MSKRFKLMTISLALVGILVAAFSGAAFADAPAVTDDNEQNYCGAGWGGGHGQGAICSETVSELLGLPHGEIETLRHEGKSMVEIAAAQGVSEDTLVETILAAKKEAVQERVTAGTLTQEQADLMFQQMEQRTTEMVNRTTTGPYAGHGAMGHRGGQSGYGSCYGDSGLGTGPGMMQGWGRGMR
ncbi:DUF2680 domain-containing protein [Chloroflexota bacterium]